MKVGHLSYCDHRGGAAIASRRLHDGLRRIGIESAMHTQGERDDWQDLLHPFINQHARTNVSNSYFSMPRVDTALALDCDVVNLHWVAHQLSPSALASISQPIVWTLHDQRPFTGGCHYTGSCEGFTKDCTACPQLSPSLASLPEISLRWMREAIAIKQPVIVAPSQWLAGEAARSAVFRDLRIDVIPYGIDLATFRPRDRNAVRQQLGLPQDKLIVMFGAEHLGERRKGFSILQQALHEWTHPDVELVAFGRGHSGLNAIHLGHTDDPALTLCAADIVLCPTLQDNLPNVVMEAMACGAAVIASDVGGVPDMISDGEHGRLVPAGDTQALRNTLEAMCNDRLAVARFGAAAREKCEREYALQHQAQRYAALYEELTQPAPTQTPSPVQEIALKRDTTRERAGVRASDEFGSLETAMRAALLQAQAEQTKWLQSQLIATKAKLTESHQRLIQSRSDEALVQRLDQAIGTRSTLSPERWLLKATRSRLRSRL